MTPVDVEALMQRASSGDGDAQMALARVFDHEGRHDLALQWLQRAADGGHLPSLTTLGARLLTGQGAPQMPSQGSQMLGLAADKGDAQACSIVAILSATGLTRPQSWSGALDYLFRAAQLGDWRARQQIAILVDNPDLGMRLPGLAEAAPWARARTAIDMGAWLRPPPPKKISESPRIVVFENFLSRTVCEWVIELARQKLSASRAINAGSDETPAVPSRTNTGTGFTLLETDVLVQIINARIAAASGAPFLHQEATNVLHYAPGEEHKPRYDFLDPDEPDFAEAARRGGQRIATFLVYLNDAFEGGETEFPLLGTRYRGQPGDAIMFVNVDWQGGVDTRTLHAGRSVTGGEKWLLSKWIRDRPFAQF